MPFQNTRFSVARRSASCLLAAMAILSCSKKAPPPPPPSAVKFVIVHPQQIDLTTDLPGRTVAFRTAEIRPQVSGIVQKRLFVEGTDVRAHQQLYQIDPALYRATFDSAAAAASASAALVERYRPLAEVNAISHQDFDNAVASAAENRATTQTAAVNLVYTKLLSPISGRIGRSSVTEGALVTSDQTAPLATVQQLDPIYVDVSQPSSVLLRLKREFAAGQLHHAGNNQTEVRLTLEDGSDYPGVGTLQFTEVSVEETTGSVTLRAVFPNPDRLLLPGMFVHERLTEGQRTDALLVPQQGISRGPTGDASAMVVVDGNKIEVRKLVTGRAIGNSWLVSEGLKDGDRVVVEGLQTAKPGSVVDPKEFVAVPANEKTSAKPAQVAAQ